MSFPTRLPAVAPVRTLLIRLSAAVIVMGPAIVLATSGEPRTGRVSGQIRFAGPASVRPLAAAPYGGRHVGAPGPARPAVLNVLVYLKDPPAVPSLAPQRAEIRQEGESFVPGVLGITRGSSVEFPNRDDYFHNVFSLSRGATFDLGRYPRGQTRVRQFTTPGLVKVFCHLHAHMHAVIRVFDHPWFATPDPDGSFTIGDVPPGRYKLAAWHERVGEAVVPLVVEAGGDVRSEIALPVVEE